MTPWGGKAHSKDKGMKKQVFLQQSMAWNKKGEETQNVVCGPQILVLMKQL